MKNFLSLTMLVVSALLSTSARAQSGVSICNSIGSDAERVKCIANLGGRGVTPAAVNLCRQIGENHYVAECAGVVAGRAISDGAVEVCRHVGTNDGVVACARAIVDKDYTRDELSFCRQHGDYNTLVACMRSAGRRRATYQSPPAVRRGASVVGSWHSSSGNVFTIADNFEIVRRSTSGATTQFRGQWMPGRTGRDFTYIGQSGIRSYGYFDDRRPNEIRIEADNQTFWWTRL